MADGFSVNVTGLAEVDQKLVLLGAVAGERVMRSTMIFASKPLLEQVQANLTAIQSGSGALHKATRRVFIRGSSAGARFTGGLVGLTGSRFVVSVAPKTKDRVATTLANLFYKRRRPVRGVFWGHLVEWGFAHSRANRKIPGKNMFTQAANARGTQVIETFRQRIGRAVDRALKRQRAE